MTHARLHLLSGQGVSQRCKRELARLGTYLDPVAGPQRAHAVTVYHCPWCDRVLEVIHAQPFDFDVPASCKLVASYVYSLAALPRPRRRPQ